jgi:N-acetylneuraminate synthase
MNAVMIGESLVGPGQPCYFIGEIGINHNGDLEIAKRLIEVAAEAGCDAVKFQKRSPEFCVPAAQRDVMRETPWGYITYLEYRMKVELGEPEYREIDRHCRDHGVAWFASCWDEPSVDFMQQFDVPCYKVASACLTDRALLKRTRAAGKPIVLSTGMSTLDQIDAALEIIGRDDVILLHAVSTYPAHYDELNLYVIETLRERYGLPVGYSGHETGLASSVAAVALGACVVERHITLDRSMWGSDHAASLEPSGLTRLIRDIRLVQQSLGTPEKRVLDSELPIIKRLRLEQ